MKLYLFKSSVGIIFKIENKKKNVRKKKISVNEKEKKFLLEKNFLHIFT